MTTHEVAALIQSRERTCRRIALSLSAIAAAIASAVLLGWIIDSDPLKRVAGSVIMLPLTALTFLCASAALAIQTITSDRLGWRRIGGVLSGIVLLVGAVMLAQRVGGFELPVNDIVFSDALKRYPYRPLGLMAGNTAVAFTLIGLALVFPTAQLWGRRFANGMALGIVAVSAVALVGYAYGVRSLYSFDQYAAMAFCTALCSLALGIGVIVASPARGLGAILIADDAGAIFTRRLLPIAIAVPFILGLAWLHGRRIELFGRETGIALVVVSIAAIYTAFLFHGARAVGTLDRECRNALKNAEHARSLADEANRGKAEFLMMMSHELRTPLNAIRGYTQLLELGVRGPITEEQRVDLARIRRSEEHLLGIIGDILDFASVERGHYRYTMAPVAIGSVLDEAISAVAPFADSRHVIIVRRGWHDAAALIAITSDNLVVLADAQKLRQAFINLLANAIKCSDVGGRVMIDVQPQIDRVLVSISDSGRGIPADRLTTIFEPFTQLEPALTRTSEGVGLGLAISQRLLRGMNSDIQVESTVGVGSRFFMLLPRWQGGASGGVMASDFDVRRTVEVG